LKTWLSLITLVFFIISPAISTATENAPLEPYKGFLSDDTDDLSVKLKLKAGDFVFALAEALTDDLDPYLILKDSKGATLIENDDINFSSLDSLLGFYIERDGIYELVLSNVDGTSGKYQLNVWTVSDAEQVDELVTEADSLDSGEEGNYELELVEGQIILLQTETLDGNLDPYLFLVDPYDNIIGLNDDFNPSTLDSYLLYVVPETGIYEVAVTAWYETSGEYHVSAQIFESPSGSPIISTKVITYEERVAELTSQSDDVIEGFVGDEHEIMTYTVELEAGAGLIIKGESQPRILDMAIRIYNADESLLADSDDWSDRTFSPVTYFIAPTTDVYFVEISAENETAGDFVIGFEYVDAEEVIQLMRVELSGPIERLETEHFIIFYTLEGADAVDPERAYFIADILENVYDIQINEMGWNIPIQDDLRGGDARYDVYIKNIYAETNTLGYVAPEYPVMDNPHSDHVEAYAMGGYIVVDGILADETPEDAERIIIATLAHEFHHLVQFGYNATGDNHWYYEATATYMEVATLPPYNEALIYVEDVLTYPEICLGVTGEADPSGGSLMYGTWLFIQSLVDTYGDDVLKQYWQNLAIYGHGWEALEITLASYGAVIHDAVARYHIQNLLRGYELAPLFEGRDRVWLGGIIHDEGIWKAGGDGVQELGVHYNLIDLKDGVYHFSLERSPYHLWLYAIGIDTENNTADVYNLGYSGSVDVSGYDEFVLMIFNTDYHDELDNCNYTLYAVSIEAGSAPVNYSMDATNYLSIQGKSDALESEELE
jgi:hypothetical protein